MNVALYLGYLVWLFAGLGDFLCHRRTDLSHTSGLTESALHLLQLATIGAGVVLMLAFELTPTLASLLLAIIVMHAVVGYLDTRSAYGLRVLSPIEQHLHSILDMAPSISLASAWLLFADPIGTGLRLREPAVGVALWAAAIIPALALCVVPALMEFREVLAARRLGMRRER